MKRRRFLFKLFAVAPILGFFFPNTKTKIDAALISPKNNDEEKIRNALAKKDLISKKSSKLASSGPWK
jgi:hypothetical protein